MVRYGMVIDTTRCVGCSNCFGACKDEFVGNDFLPWSVAQPDAQYGFYGQAAYPTGTPSAGAWVIPGQTWMKDVEVESGKFPNVQSRFVYMPCLQCDTAPCMAAAQNGAIYKRPDGILIIDPTKSAGQTQLVDSCPYGQIYWNNALQIPQKCTFCAHLVDAGKNPKCVDACPMNAITFGDLDNANRVALSKSKSTQEGVLRPW